MMSLCRILIIGNVNDVIGDVNDVIGDVNDVIVQDTDNWEG